MSDDDLDTPADGADYHHRAGGNGSILLDQRLDRMERTLARMEKRFGGAMSELMTRLAILEFKDAQRATQDAANSSNRWLLWAAICGSFASAAISVGLAILRHLPAASVQ